MQSIAPPLPSRQTLDRLIEICRHESWLFTAVNGYALSDIASLSESGPSAESEQLTARALMLVTTAIGLPLLASASPNGLSSSTTFKSIDELMGSYLQADLPHPDSPAWMPAVIRVFADGARDLVNLAQARSTSPITPATFIIRLLLVELSLSQFALHTVHADLASAVSEARLLHLYATGSDKHPRLSTGPARASHLSRALRGLMQSKEEPWAFWNLFLLDTYQSRLALLPTMLERRLIRTPFPCRIEAKSGSPVQRSSEEVEAYLQRDHQGLPILEPSDDSMSLLVKVTLVLDQCCEYAMLDSTKTRAADGLTGRSTRLEVERDKSFGAAHESIRNSRMMLSRFDDRTIARSDMFTGDADSGRSRESLIPKLVSQDPLRFAAEATHHLAVLSLFETAMNVTDPFIPAGESRNMICNASVWLSRLADMALQDAIVLYGLPSFCSSAFFVAARWLLFLQRAEPNQFHRDFSTLVRALSKRGERYSRDRK